MKELEKCPCCGGDAIYSYYTKQVTDGEGERYSAFVVCSTCGLRTKSMIRDVSYSAEDICADLWNARANTSNDGGNTDPSDPNDPNTDPNDPSNP